MSNGFPGRSSHADLGGNRRDRFPVTKPDEEIGSDAWNTVQWQVAGMNKISALVSLTVSSAGEKVAGGEAWNSADAASKRVTITHDNTGEYVIAAQAASYNDWRGEDGPLLAVVFTGAIVTPQAAVPIIPTVVVDSATQVTVYLFDPLDSHAAVDAAFTVDIK